MSQSPKHILVTGGAGYIGSILVPKLLELGHRVRVFDAFCFGEEGLSSVRESPRLELVRGDVRDPAAVESALRGVDHVIHLAAIANDPCSELDPELTRAVNGEAAERLMRFAKAAGVRRFLYASSASVYGIKDTEDVTEDLPLEPITVYAETKVQGERVLASLVDDEFVGVAVRAATVCGYSPRLRLDLTINILTHAALTKREILVFGGNQMRPNVHVQDLAGFYIGLLDQPAEKVRGRAFNVVQSNASVMGLAELVQRELLPRVGEIPIRVVPSGDLRSYHLSGERARRELGYVAEISLGQAVRELAGAISDGRVPDASSPVYRNVEHMKANPTVWR
ncbi:MAG: NAD-dependent epimerase/dehydratase family protein [Deltaproteobacteria bacterium]|nr:NAD-dependent epimerase/dehydratase family protein [Deltaproteobacteria bacterium]